MKISLKALRVNAGFTQDEVAEKLKVTRKTIQNWEGNITYPDAYKLMSLCTIYNCDMRDIFLPEKLAESEKGEE